jgi:diaminopimelate epimerase
MRFSKWHALGNSYLVVERSDLSEPLAPDLASRLCDPHYGVGADGILEVAEVHGAEAEVVVWNPDGSVAELSGNGARIAAMWLARRSAVAFPVVRIGERSLAARIEGDEVEVDLGPADVGRPEALEVRGKRLEFTPVSLGNPHAVFRREPTRRELRRLGPLVESHERFPARTNVQLVRADGPGDLTVRVWERGAGETLSSGSGSTAAAVAAVVDGRAESPVTVQLDGGDLVIEVSADLAVTLTGTVELVAEARFSSEFLTTLEALV